MADFLKPIGRGAEKNLRRTKKYLCGKNSPSLRHSYNNSFSVFKSGTDKHPMFTVNSEGEYDIPLFKLIMIILGIISAAVLIGFTVKKIAKCRRRKLIREIANRDYYTYADGEDLPF